MILCCSLAQAPAKPGSPRVELYSSFLVPEIPVSAPSDPPIALAVMLQGLSRHRSVLLRAALLAPVPFQPLPCFRLAPSLCLRGLSALLHASSVLQQVPWKVDLFRLTTRLALVRVVAEQRHAHSQIRICSLQGPEFLDAER